MSLEPLKIKQPNFSSDNFIWSEQYRGKNRIQFFKIDSSTIVFERMFQRHLKQVFRQALPLL